ncbi:hypothetical protein KEM52_005134, partial [Ascosphaera acerosa]
MIASDLDQELQARRQGRPVRTISADERAKLEKTMAKYRKPSGVSVGGRVYKNLQEYAEKMLTLFTPKELVERMQQEYQCYEAVQEQLGTLDLWNQL